MACFTPENNAYCSPNVNVFLNTRLEQWNFITEDMKNRSYQLANAPNNRER